MGQVDGDIIRNGKYDSNSGRQQEVVAVTSFHEGL